MKTDELIAILSQDSTAKKPRLSLEVLGSFLLVFCFLTTQLWLGLRPELDTASFPVSFWFKTLLLGSLVTLSLQALKSSSVPLGRFKLRFFGIGFAVFVVAALAYEWTTKSTNQIEDLFLLPNFKMCLIYSTLYGSGLSLVILAAVKKYAAPLNLGRTAGFIGLSAACIGGLGYSIHCPIDSPTFIVIAYGLPQLVLYGFARLLFARFLRW